MESIESLTRENFTATEWARYYKNVWMRNALARTIDVQSDINIMAKNPNQMVQVDSPSSRDVSFAPVAERLEMCKIALQDALDILESIEVVLGTADIASHYWNAEFLKVSPEASHAVMEAEPAAVTEVQEALAEVVEAVQDAAQDAAQVPAQDQPVAVEATPETQA